ncbi:(4Fe-4S)-binding protein [Streptomyces sp. NRRL F-5727]|uniref:(4Fe-4S)-binding protein n=1 Tax=Streptomyces sp. NRRL F-5727 TaxID=1463871 RepID=UPI0004CB9BF1|nr:(4Fe-4S)-binding protein [Streptomyces sp. NRRL F-5727]
MTEGTAEPGTESPTGGKPRLKEYDGEGITVTFEPRRCLHAAECVHGLPEVFDLSRRPWVLPDAAVPERVAEVIRRCPSGALQYHPAAGVGAEEAPDVPTTVRRKPSGQLRVRGDLLVAGEQGVRHETRALLCGCGASANQPYCDHSGPCAEPDDDVAEER